MSTSKVSLVIKSFERQIAENAAGFVMQYTRQMGVNASLVRLPTKVKRFSILKSPFKYHKHFEAFQVWPLPGISPSDGAVAGERSCISLLCPSAVYDLQTAHHYQAHAA